MTQDYPVNCVYIFRALAKSTDFAKVAHVNTLFCPICALTCAKNIEIFMLLSCGVLVYGVARETKKILDKIVITLYHFKLINYRNIC